MRASIHHQTVQHKNKKYRFDIVLDNNRHGPLLDTDQNIGTIETQLVKQKTDLCKTLFLFPF